MTLALSLLALPVLWIFCAFAPGLAMLAGARARPLEKLAAAVGASILILYLTSFAAFAAEWPRWTYFAVTAGGVVALVSRFRDWRALALDHEVRRSLTGVACILTWLALVLLLIRNYSGGGWSGDWLEHYQRALFFLDRLPPDTQLIDFYWLPARPPLMNVVTAHFLAHVGRAFPVHQVTTLLLNAVVLLPLFLLAPRFSESKPLRIAPLIAFLALNPMFVENMTYGWTRPLASFFVLAGVYAYDDGRRTGDARAYGVAWVAMAAAMLTHYSAAPYLLFLGLHFGITVVARRKIPLGRGAAMVVIPAALLSTWVGWSLYVYGAEITFGSNSTAFMSSGTTWWDHVVRFFQNTRNTLIPHPFHVAPSPWIEQATWAGYAKDWLFLIYQTNALAAAGSVSVILLGYEARRGLWVPFWTPFALGTFALGIAVSYTVEEHGSAHVCLQPLALLALCLFAARFPAWPPWLRRTALAGLAVDGVLGIGLLGWFQHQVPEPAGTARIWSFGTYLNWKAKTDADVRFLGDLIQPEAASIVAGAAILLAIIFWIQAGLVSRTPGTIDTS